jgi:cytoskeletal protein RodZ
MSCPRTARGSTRSHLILRCGAFTDLNGRIEKGCDAETPSREILVNEPYETTPKRRSRRRDANLNMVSRLTRGIAALAILSTVVFGGLAAANTSSSSTSTTSTASSAASTATTTTQTSSPSASTTAPTASTQAPAAVSGGS